MIVYPLNSGGFIPEPTEREVMDAAETDRIMAMSAEAPDDFEDRPADESLCPACEGDGGDKWNDYCLPCPVCGGDGRLW